LCVAPARISRLMPLLELPEEFQRKLHDGTVAAEVGYYLAWLPAGEERDRMMLKALEGKLTRDAAASNAKRHGVNSSGTTAVKRVSFKMTAGRTFTISGEGIDTENTIKDLEEIIKDLRKARSKGWEVSRLAKVLRDRAAAGGAA